MALFVVQLGQQLDCEYYTSLGGARARLVRHALSTQPPRLDVDHEFGIEVYTARPNTDQLCMDDFLVMYGLREAMAERGLSAQDLVALPELVFDTIQSVHSPQWVRCDARSPCSPLDYGATPTSCASSK